MDYSWQMKRGSALQSSTQSMPSSSQEPRNQMEMNIGSIIYPHVGQDSRSATQRRIQDPIFPNTLNYRVDHADLGNSFVALLSGPSSLLQCDLQELSNPKPFSTSGKLPVDSSSVIASACGNGVPMTSSGLLSENLSKQNMRNGPEIYPLVSFRPVSSSICSSNSVLHNGIQPVNSNIQSSDLAKLVFCPTVPGNEKVKNFCSLGGELHSTSPVNDRRLQRINVQTSQKVPLEANSSVSNQPPAFMSGCPRVFCFGTSGDLLLSNTGLLGVVCSCHFLHMSLSKFCEHSGVYDVNPGDAVRMDSGETIAQWRKLYFQKFGIRAPEDQSGWDWREGFSASANLVKSSSIMPNMSNNSNLSHLVGSSGALVRSGQPLDNMVSPQNPHTDQNLANDAFHNKQQRKGQNSSNFLPKGLTGTTQRNFHLLADNQNVDCPISRCSTVAKFVGGERDDGCQSVSAYIDSIVKNGNSSPTHPKLHNSRIVGKDSDIIRINSAKDGVILDRDAGSSNIELRLGQPHQQSRGLGNSVLSVVGPQPLDTLVIDPLKSFSQDNTVNSRENEESRQYLQPAAGASSSISGRGQNQLNARNQALGFHNAINAARLDNFKGNMAKCSGSSLPTHFNPQLKKSVYSEATNNMVDGSKHIMSKMLHCESHTAKCASVNVPWNGGNSSERNLDISKLGFPRLMESSSSFIGVGGSTGPRFSAAHDKNNYSHQLSNVLPDASDTRKNFNYPEKISYLGNSGRIDHGSLRSMESPMGYGLVPPSHTVSMGFPLSTSTSISYSTSASSKQEGIGVIPYFLDENMRLLAWRQILELSKQQHAISSLGMNQGRLGSSSCSKIQHSPVDPSICGEPRQTPNLTRKQDVFEAAMQSAQSGATSRMSADVEKLGPVTGLNNWFDFSTFAQGKSLHPKDIEMHHQLSHVPLPFEQPLLRLGRSENNIRQSREHENCCRRVPYTCYQGSCSCATKCLEGNYESRVGSSPNALKEQIKAVRGEASILIAPKSVKDSIVPKKNTISMDQSGKLKGQLPKNIICHSSQWRDVPSKVIGMCDVASKDCAAHVHERTGHAEGQLGDTAAKCFSESIEVAVSLKEREISNISSGCSAPAVTQASIEVNKIDSSTIDAVDARYVNNLVVDEGSGIDKCWSSDDALESERSSEFLASTCKTNQRREGSSNVLCNQSSRTLLEELKLIDSLTWKKVRNQNNAGLGVHGKINHSQKFERDLKSGKRKRATKSKMLDASSPTHDPSEVHSEKIKYTSTSEFPSYLSKDMQRHPPSCQGTSRRRGSYSIEPSSKRNRSVFSSSKLRSHKRDLHRLYDRMGKDGYQTELNGAADFYEILEVSGGTKFQREQPSHSNAEKPVNCNSVGSGNTSYGQHVNACFGKARPVVFGKYGEICNGNLDGEMLKPAKLVPLSRVLKASKRCTLPKRCKPRLTSTGELKKTSFKGSNAYFDELSGLRKAVDNGSYIATGCDEMILETSVEETKRTCAIKDKQYADELSMVEKERDIKNKQDCRVLDTKANARLKPKCKEIRKRSLYELTGKGNNFTSESCSLTKISTCAAQMKAEKILKKAEDSKPHERGLYEASAKLSAIKTIEEQGCTSVSVSEAFCCVCGSSNKDDINCLLKCSRCLIIVHQACYGVSKVPKGHWYCRPCRTSSKDIVCVLCGYGGGAMTRALRSGIIVKSLLKVWNMETESRPKNTSSAEPLQDELNLLHSSGSRFEGGSIPVLRPVNLELSTKAVWKMDMQNQLDIAQHSPFYASDLKLHNSITAGVIDSTVKQWVHMVCGLWTPGTRCTNVDTMSAFDVSGASRPIANAICSICNRPGGSCIQCRILNCSVQFHPWCAHQKGLLQSEVEGVDYENVGFYGRCVLHATHPMCEFNSDPTETGCQTEKELTSARTEGYKGRKRDGFRHNFYGQSNYKGGCLVPQEQLNAWIHINGQKSCTYGLPKPQTTDIEYDCRKEYARYKQTNGWKHLVVYKSGIHALGLYTSRFISRGEMVVEYVGEIVGLRVADKRENEYQSGRKLQYKSACYFFRIDKEHIIDATRKGGIARFVNHSCLPNCVAKVISVRNEKKVVFFAERDIFPGEEITYDYHFNHEDEGKKIPCFCNSKNCRRYLN